MKKQLIFLMLAASISLSACGNGNDNGKENAVNETPMDHSSHSSSSEVPKGLKEAVNPTYKVGSEVIIKTGHMEGMEGAKATIVGAYDTTAYAVSYTPTTGGERVSNHKWIIHEDIKDAATEPYKPGADVIMNADHMEGMMGAKAVIDTAEQTTVYMVDYTPTTGGDKVTNHKWVTESEISAAK